MLTKCLSRSSVFAVVYFCLIHLAHGDNIASKVVQGTEGMAVTAHPEATRVAKEILEKGGNAADAAVAVGFAITVLEPTMNSIGGRSQVLLRDAKGQYTAINGMTEIPAGYEVPEKPFADGYPVIATPGVVAALARVHNEHGSMNWRVLLQPAIVLAEKGFVLLPGEAARHQQALEAIQDNAGFQQNILQNGAPRAAGTLFKQPNLAKTLTRIADHGAEDFYTGVIANKIAADMVGNGGHVTKQDLAAYRALDGRYITTTYRGYDIHSIAAPAGGGLVVKALNILENFPLSELNHLEWAAVVNQALAMSVQTMADDYLEVDLEQVASKTWAKQKALDVVVPELSDVPQLSLSDAGQHDWSGMSWGEESHHTTHFVTADCRGMAVSITQTIGPLFGSKVITPELGFAYASTMGSYLSAAAQSPGSRPRTTIAPTYVTKNGELVLAIGAAGGLRILSGIVQVISRMVDQGMTLEAALAAPRIHPQREIIDGRRTALPMAFHAELTPGDGWPEAALSQWQAAGFEVAANDKIGAFARVHALSRVNHRLVGVADPDWEGSAAAPAKGCNP